MVCAGLYAGVAIPLLADVETLDFQHLEGWTSADWRHLGGALVCCPKLQQLYLSEMSADDAAMAAFCGELGNGAVPALGGLVLFENKIGDEGMRHLADALARGAAPALETLGLNGNVIGDEGMRHLGDALARGAAPALLSHSLNLNENTASDDAQRAVHDALKQRK